MNRMARLAGLAACLLASLGIAQSAIAQTKAKAPNVVVILADDFGFECVGANGGGSYKTPRLDKLAASGMRFEHCYVQPLCTPTRVQLLTGQTNRRNYVAWATMPPNSLTFAQLFRRAGYATSIIGKWQLGKAPDLPAKLGFDEHNLWQHTRRGSRYANPSHDIDGKMLDFTMGEYGPDLLNDAAIDFVRRNKDRPFLLYYPLTLTHGPYAPAPGTPEYNPKAKKEDEGANKKHFGAMVAHMDTLIGRLIDEVDRLGLGENTLILFVGDNGTGAGISSLLRGIPYAGGKGSTTAAGMHVPLIARWTGAIPAGRTCGDLIESTDFFPTLCQAAKVGIPADAVIDGKSFLPQLRGEKGEPRSHYYCWFNPQPSKGMPQEFAANHRYKLYATGDFFDYQADRDEKTPLTELSPEAVRARQSLRAVLDECQKIRPAAAAK